MTFELKHNRFPALVTIVGSCDQIHFSPALAGCDHVTSLGTQTQSHKRHFGCVIHSTQFFAPEQSNVRLIQILDGHGITKLSASDAGIFG